MQIQKISVFTPSSNIVSLSKFSFKGITNGQDSFEPSIDTKRKKFEEAKIKNPNSAFLYNPDMTYEEKVAELKKRPEIKPVQKVICNLNIDSQSIKDDIFEFDILEKPITQYYRPRTLNMRYIDTENPFNKETIARLNAKRKHLYDFDKYTHKYNMPNEIFRRYLKLGRMERYEVYPERADKLGNHSCIIDASSEKNIKAIENFRKLNLRSKFLDRLLKSRRNDKVYANVLDLKKFGIKDCSAIAKAIKSGTIDGLIKEKETDKGKKYCVYADLNSERSRKYLSAMRNRDCMEVKAFSKKYNIPISELEDAYFENKIDYYPTALFPTDWGSQYIDVTSERNLEFIAQKLLEQQIQSEILHKQKKGLNSAKMKIAWYLSPNTKMTAKKLADGNDYLASIISKKQRIEERIQEVEESENSQNNDEEVEKIETLTSKEEAVLLGFFKKMWEQAGTCEYSNGLKKAGEIINLYKSSGIDAIEDEEIRKIITEACQ